jgi:hypothetical protein
MIRGLLDTLTASTDEALGNCAEFGDWFANVMSDGDELCKKWVGAYKTVQELSDENIGQRQSEE